MIRSNMRGHEIYYDGIIWRYLDTNEYAIDNRICKRCGKSPTKDGYDACTGYIEGVINACCGHGVSTKYEIR